MPNISYDQSPNQSFVAKPKNKLALPHFSLGKLGRLILFAVTLFLTWLLATFLSGFFATIGGNATVVGLEILFDPQLTIAYIATYYFLSHFYDLNKSQMYYFFLLSLFLSFSVSFIEGALMLVMLPPVLKKLKLISTESKA